MSHKLPFERELYNLFKQKYPSLAIRLIDALTNEKKPCDFICCKEDGGIVLVEAKADRADVFQFREIPAHQRQALTKIANTEHGQAFLAVNLRTTRGPGHSWLIPWGAWKTLEKNWHKKSVRREELIEHFSEYELIRITGGWEFSKQHRFRGDL